MLIVINAAWLFEGIKFSYEEWVVFCSLEARCKSFKQSN